MGRSTLSFVLAALLGAAPVIAQEPRSLDLRLSLDDLVPPSSTPKREVTLALWDCPVWRIEYAARRQGAYGDPLLPGIHKLPWSTALAIGYTDSVRPGVLINGPPGHSFREMSFSEAFTQELAAALLLAGLAQAFKQLNR